MNQSFQNKLRHLLKLKFKSFTTLSLFAEYVPSSKHQTAATDGKRIYLNSDYVEKLTPKELDGLILHEVLHAALLHTIRRVDRDPVIWNWAADIVVNGMIRVLKKIQLPNGAIIDKELEHLSVEEVYSELNKNRHSTPGNLVIDLVDGLIETDSNHASEEFEMSNSSEVKNIGKMKMAILSQKSWFDSFGLG